MKIALATLFVGSAAASSSIAADSSSSIAADSKVGRKLLSKARRLDGNNNNNMSWVAGYSLRFEKCATSHEYYGGYFGGNGNQNNNNKNNNNNRNNFNGLYQQRLVHFKLCPKDSCSSGCSGGADYVIDMNEFVQSYMEHKQEVMEAKCESVRENCYCENANDDQACESQCYMDAGIYDNCVEQQNNGNNQNGQQQFNLQEALECRRLEVDENAAQWYAYNNGGQQNNQYYYNGQNQNQNVEFFVGPYCSANGKSILLGVFMDETCSFTAPDGIYSKLNYGQSLPYEKSSIVAHDCISCTKVDENANNNNQNNQNNNNQNQQQAEVAEVCERLYEASGKCESSLSVSAYFYPNTMACDFIKGLSGGAKARITASWAEIQSKTPQILAGVFAVSTLAFGAVAYHFHRKIQGQSDSLVGNDNGTMA